MKLALTCSCSWKAGITDGACIPRWAISHRSRRSQRSMRLLQPRNTVRESGARPTLPRRGFHHIVQHVVELWHEHIGHPTIADAVLDRLVHGAHRIELKGESMRKLRAAKSHQA